MKLFFRYKIIKIDSINFADYVRSSLVYFSFLIELK